MADGAFVRALRHEAALSNTFMKGRTLMLNGSVVGLEDEGSRFSRIVVLDGTVRGSKGDTYSTHVELDTDTCEVVDYDCDCPAAIRYPGMCKHAIATALAYLDRSGIERIEGLRTPLRTGNLAEKPADSHGWGSTASRPKTTPNPNFPFPAPVPTSSNLRAALDALQRERVAAASAIERAATVDVDPDMPPAMLEPKLAAYYNPLFSSRFSWALEFKIRRGSVSYVVRDIEGMVDAWERGGTFSYGKRMTFAHVPVAFDERSAQMLDKMVKIVAYLRDLTTSKAAARDFSCGTSVAERALPLGGDDLVALLDLCLGTSIAFDPGSLRGMSARREFVIAVEDEGALPPAKIVESTGGSYDLRFPADMHCIAAKTGAYLVDSRRARRMDQSFAREAAPLLAALMPCRTPLHIAASDVVDFCRTALPVLKSHTDLSAPAALSYVAPEPSFVVTVGDAQGLITCKVEVSYDEWTGDLFELGVASVGFEDAQPGVPPRDAVAETRAMSVAERYFERFHDGLAFDERDDEALYTLLTQGLRDLSSVGEVLLSDRLRQVAVRPAPRLSVRAAVKHHLLDVELGASGMSRDDLLAYLEGYRRHQKFARLTTGDIIRLDESARAASDLADSLGVDAIDLLDGVTLPASNAYYVDAMLEGAHGFDVARDEAFERTVHNLDTLGQADFTVPASLKATLRGYQVDGFQWLGSLEHLGLGGILADDMGLGKTLQVIAHVLARVEAGDCKTTLVVCPASLVYNWMVEIGRFAPTLDAVAIVGAKQQRNVQIAGAADHDVVVTSYDLMRRDIDEYAACDFSRVVLDEAQYIKNPLTKVARAAKRLPARVRFALTGTPIENRLTELWSIFDFLMPGMLGSQDSFAKRFENPVEHAEGDTAARLQALIAPFVLRRVKEDVVADLPEKIENTVFAKLDGEQRKLYLANQDRIAEQVQHRQPREFKQEKLKVLAELTKLRQICCDPRLHYDGYTGGSAKLDTCMELVRNAIDGGHRILLFSQFTGMLDIIGSRLSKEKVSYFKLVGATSKERRAQMVEQFQQGAAPVFLISLKAGGVGLNLTAADVVIHYDPWWNVAAQDQATDRAHRIGQKNTVTVFKLICRDTIEERIQAMQESKRDLVKSVLDGQSMSSALFTREDVLMLLGGDGRD